MTLLIVLWILLSINTWFILTITNPLIIRILIMLISSLITVIITINSSWFAIIMFIIYVGGILIIFSYFTRVSSNDIIQNKISMHFIILPYFIFFIIKIFPSSINSSLKLYSLYPQINLNIVLILGCFLLFLLFIIVKLVSNSYAPLRGFLS